MLRSRVFAALSALASLVVLASGSPVAKREGPDETVGGFGLTDIIVVEALGFGYQDLTFRVRDLSSDSTSDAKAIARDFQNLTFNELENVRPLEGQITGRVIDLDQYSTILAEFDLGILERSFLNELTRKKSLFRQAKEAIRKGIKQQLEVLEIFARISKIYGPKIITGLNQITETRRASLQKALAAFS